jgi:hypothetical protein
MTIIECRRIDCLNHGKEVCTANRVKWYKGKCDEYITSAGGMKLQMAPMERKHGSLQNLRTKP